MGNPLDTYRWMNVIVEEIRLTPGNREPIDTVQVGGPQEMTGSNFMWGPH